MGRPGAEYFVVWGGDAGLEEVINLVDAPSQKGVRCLGRWRCRRRSFDRRDLDGRHDNRTKEFCFRTAIGSGRNEVLEHFLGNLCRHEYRHEFKGFLVLFYTFHVVCRHVCLLILLARLRSMNQHVSSFGGPCMPFIIIVPAASRQAGPGRYEAARNPRVSKAFNCAGPRMTPHCSLLNTLVGLLTSLCLGRRLCSRSWRKKQSNTAGTPSS